MNKKFIIPVAIIGGAILVLGILWYYQKQGLIKVFPTGEERHIKKILAIDRSKFRAAQGLSAADFEAEIKKLEEQRTKVLENPKDAQAWFNFAYTKEYLNDHEGAVAAWEKAFELQPLNFVTAQNLGNTYQYFLKDFHKAEFYYDEALKIRPDYTQAFQGLLDLYRYNLKEKQDLVEPLLLAAIKNDPQNRLPYTISLVEFFADKGDLDKAKKYLGEVKQISPAEAGKLLESYPALK